MAGPLDSFWNWIGGTWWPTLRDWLGELAQWLVDKLYLQFKLFYAIATTLASAFILFVSFGLWAVQQLANSLASIDLQGVKAGSATMLQYGAFVNRFIPLVEGAAVAITLFNLWLAVVTIRWIKSFIPTMSN